MTTPETRNRQRGFVGHPPGLATLFFTEMWERFSYYGMRAILAMYLYFEVVEGGLGLPQETAKSAVQAYGACVYLTAIAGGWLADRLLGARRSVFWGGVLIMLGHISMAIPNGVSTVFLGTALIILGSGLLKPNISTMVGGLYSDTDERRDAGFTIFYMGVNIGALVGQLISGLLQQEVGFHWGFGAAAVGMALGLIVYVLGGRSLGTAGSAPLNPLPAEDKSRVITRVVVTAGVFVLAFAGLWLSGLVGLQGLVNTITIVSCILPIVYFVVLFTSPKVTQEEKDRLIAYIPLFLATALFFLLYEQQSTSLVVVAEEMTDRSLLGWEIPVSWFQSVNPFAIIVLAPLFALLWMKLGQRQPSTPMKFAGGLVFIGFSFVWMVLAGFLAGGDGKYNMLMIALVFVFVTVGEMMISPVGLSATTKLAPKAFVSQTMGFYFLAIAMGQGIGAQVVRLHTAETNELYFGTLGLIAAACGVLLAVAVRKIRPLMHGVL